MVSFRLVRLLVQAICNMEAASGASPPRLAAQVQAAAQAQAAALCLGLAQYIYIHPG